MAQGVDLTLPDGSHIVSIDPVGGQVQFDFQPLVPTFPTRNWEKTSSTKWDRWGWTERHPGGADAHMVLAVRTRHDDEHRIFVADVTNLRGFVDNGDMCAGIPACIMYLATQDGDVVTMSKFSGHVASDVGHTLGNVSLCNRLAAAVVDQLKRATKISDGLAATLLGQIEQAKQPPPISTAPL